MRLLSKISLVVVIFTAQIAAQIIFSENFEGSMSGWTVSPTVRGWEFGTPTAGPASAPEGARCAGTVLNGQYSSNTSYILTSSTISLPNQSDIYLNFYEWLSTEYNYDHAYVGIEQNGSGEWIPLHHPTTSDTTWQYRELDLSSYRNSNIRLHFIFGTSNVNNYYGWYIDNIQIFHSSTINLTIQSGINGTTTPSGTVSARSCTPVNVSAIPNVNYRFDKWSAMSGIPVFADSFSASTIIFTPTDATIRATFISIPVYDLTPAPTTYNFTTHAYNVRPDSGVLFRFTAPDTGNYVVTLKNIDSASVRMFFFGEDSTFENVVNTLQSTRWDLQQTFSVGAGKHCYFRVAPFSSSSFTKDFIIFWDEGVTLVPQELRVESRPGAIITEHKKLHMPTNVAPPKADIIIAMDLTGSMGGALNNVKRNAVAIMNQIRSIIPDSYFGVVSFMDYNGTFTGCSYSKEYGSGIDYPYRMNRSLTDDISATSASITALSLGDGNDGPESYTRVLYETYGDSANIKWRSGAKRFVLLWGDANPHDCSYGLDCGLPGGISGPDPGRDNIVGTTDDLALATVLSQMASKNIKLITLYNGSSYYDYWDCYSRKTGGSAFRINRDGTVPDGTDIATYLTGLLRQDVQHIDTVTLKIYNPTYQSWLSALTPSYYSNVNLDSAKDLFFDISFHVPPTTLPGLYEFDVCATGDGAVYATQKVAITISGGTTPPVANAGRDQTIFTGISGCFALAQLDGTGSSDPGGGAITYQWTGPFSGSLTGATPSVNLGTGTNTIILSVTNNSGLTDLDTVVVTVRDTFPPVPQRASLPDITGDCSAVITSAPTASDNCAGIVTATTTDPLTYSQPGNYTITWTYSDGNGNTSSQTQNVVINDLTPPVALDVNLPMLTSTCSLTVTSIPAAFDSCTRKIITGSTTSPLTYNNPGLYTITWTYTDSSGNSSTQQQQVSIVDFTAPVPDLPVLDTIRAECTVTVTDTPAATDNCNCTVIAGVTSDPLSYSTEGIYTITWRYTDRSGNTSTQTQVVIIDDVTLPVPMVTELPVLHGECSYTVTSFPQATDNCGTTISATTSDPLVYTQQGSHIITWVYDDLHGNRATQTQSIMIRDSTPPVPEVSELPVITSVCSVELIPPYATDNCGARITATTPLMNITNQGTHTVLWTYDDGNGNAATQNQTVIIDDSIPPVFAALADRTIAIRSTVPGVNLPIETPNATDNCTRVTLQGVRSDALPIDTLYFEGVTRITWTACDTNNNCSTASQTITVIRNHAPDLLIPADTSLSEGEMIVLSISSSDSDGTTPSIFIDSLPIPLVFSDSANGHATLSLHPGCTDHGTYTVKVHATDGIDTVTRECIVTINDINYPPQFDTASYYVAHEMVEFRTTIKVYDCDNPNPKIRIINAPEGAQFTDNNNGTGTFIWTPDENDNGFYVVIFEAQDDMTTVRDTIIIEVTDVNAYPPDITVSVSDTTIPLNLPVVIYATAKDRDGTPTRIRVSGLPPGALFESDNNGTALVRWTPVDIGIIQIDFIAIDAADTTVSVSKQVTLRVANINVTGPEFSPVQNFVIDQNKQFTATIAAHDPDGTIPVLSLKSGQQSDLTFKDNGNGTATISWIPPCNVSGTFNLTATASDQSFTDSVTFTITVRDVNCPPVIFRTSDINAKAGEMVRIPVKSYDPDGDTIIPTLSVGCALPGHTFTSSGNGSGTFRWQAVHEPGSYPVTFYASDGIAADSFTMHININKTGNVKILSTTSGGTIHVMPEGCHKGEFLGTDSVSMSMAPGIYHFEVHKNGYLSKRFPVKVVADSSVTKMCKLESSIPLMTLLLDTSFIAQDRSLSHSPCSFSDVNYDGYIDYTVLSDSGIKVFPGLDSTGRRFNSTHYNLEDSIPAKSIFHYAFTDWNNDKYLDCIYSDRSGTIIVANFRTGTFERVISVPNGKLYFSVFDVNNDNNKDIVVHNEGLGISVYLNQGTDIAPIFTTSNPVAITSGQSPALLHGPLTFIDIDGNSTLELLIKNEHTPAFFRINSTFTEISYIEDLNCAGKRITSDTLAIYQTGSPFSLPHVILSTASKTMLFGTHLLGDVNKDNKIDIRDISKISKLWELNETDPLWDPECNLRLSTSGQEKIDIRDISQAGKCWELQQ